MQQHRTGMQKGLMYGTLTPSRPPPQAGREQIEFAARSGPTA